MKRASRSTERALSAYFHLPRGLSLAALGVMVLSLTVFFLFDDVLFYLLFEKIFDLRLGALWKWIIAALFAALNFALALVVMKAMLRQPQTGAEGMIGAQGEVIASISSDHKGWVRVHGELWQAAADEFIAKGAVVEVVAVEGLLLRVRPQT
jgi:membrane-bound ClpP family serine protease